MTPRSHVLLAADRNLDDQAAYLAQEASLETALRFYDASGTTFGKLAGMPGLGGRMARRATKKTKKKKRSR